MKECVYRDEVLDLTDQLWQEAYNAGYYDSALRLGVLYRELEDVPTADTPVIIHCQNCAVTHNKWTGCPKLGGLVTEPDFFCAFGEPKGDSE